MNARLNELARKREQLVVRSASQRAQLCAAFRPWEKPLAFADKGMALARTLRAHPLLLAAGGAVAVYLIGRRLGGMRKWAGRLLGFWQTTRSVRSWWPKGPG